MIPSWAAVCASCSPPTMSPIAYRCGSRVRMWPSTLTKPRSTSAVVVSRPTSSTLVARPAATSSISAEISAASLPSGPTVRRTPSSSATTLAASNRALVMTLIPRRVKLRSSSLLTSRSSSGTMAGRYSSSVTCAPRSWYIDANSDPHRAGADHDDARGHRVRAQDVVRGHDPHAVRDDAGQGLDPGARGEDHVRAAEHALAAGARGAVLAREADPDLRGALEPAAALDPGHVVLLDQAADALPHPGHDLVPALGDLREVHLGRTGQPEAEVPGVADALGERGRLEHRLGGDAAAVEARAADLVLVHEGDPQPELGAAEGRGVAAGARAEDDEVEVVRGADGHRSGDLRWCHGREGGPWAAAPREGFWHRTDPTPATVRGPTSQESKTGPRRPRPGL